MTPTSPIIGILGTTSGLSRACEVARAQLRPDRCLVLVVPCDALLVDAVEAAVRLAVDERLQVLSADAVVRPGEVWLSFKPVALSEGALVQVAGADFTDVLLRSFARVESAVAVVLDDAPAAPDAAPSVADLSEAYDAILHDFGLDALLIDRADRVQHVFGGASRFLVPVGRVNATLVERVVPPWRAAVRAAIEGAVPPEGAPGRVRVQALSAGMRLIRFGTQGAQVALPAPVVSELLDEMPLLFAEIDESMCFLQLNAKARELFGVGDQDFRGRHVLEVQPRFAERLPVYRRVLSGESVDLTSTFIGDRNFDLHYRPVHRKNGTIGISVVAYDVTERETVRRRLQKVADILNAVPLGVVTVRQVGTGASGFVLDSMCSSARSELPVDLEALVGRPLSEIFPLWYDTEVPDAFLGVLATRQNVRLKTTFRPGLRDERHLQLNASWLAEDLVVVTVEDISKAVRIQRRQEAAQRLEAVGQMAAGVAHDLNGRLTAILLAAETLKTSQSADAEADVILQATHSAADLVAQLLAFSRRRPIRPEVLTVQTVLERISPILKRVLGHGIDLHLELPDEAWSVSIDPGALEQAFVNLASNAAAAMPDGGSLTIRVINRVESSVPTNARLVGEAHRQSQQTSPPAAVDAVHVEIIDAGCGMPPEIEARCFEPYFSSNDANVSSGLGLSSVLGIVEQAGGQVGLDTAVGRGTRIALALPRVGADPIVPQRDSVPSIRMLRAGPARVLVVDDEDLLRTVIVKQLRYLGYEVSQAADGESALAVVEAEPRFDLVLTDVVMPGMNGITLARRLRLADPSIAVLFMSGYSNHAAMQADEWKRARLLEKPFRPSDLRRAVRGALAKMAQSDHEN